MCFSQLPLSCPTYISKIIIEKQTQQASPRGSAVATVVISISSLTSWCIPATTGAFVDVLLWLTCAECEWTTTWPLVWFLEVHIAQWAFCWLKKCMSHTSFQNVNCLNPVTIVQTLGPRTSNHGDSKVCGSFGHNTVNSESLYILQVLCSYNWVFHTFILFSSWVVKSALESKCALSPFHRYRQLLWRKLAAPDEHPSPQGSVQGQQHWASHWAEFDVWLRTMLCRAHFLRAW